MLLITKAPPNPSLQPTPVTRRNLRWNRLIMHFSCTRDINRVSVLREVHLFYSGDSEIVTSSKWLFLTEL
jgi:hypothetical protein